MRVKSETNRLKILQAAKEEFMQAGSYTAVSVDAVAKRAGITKQTVYGYFSTKENLFMAVMTSVIGEPWKDAFPELGSVTFATQHEFAQALTRILDMIRTKFTDKSYLSLFRIVVAESQTQPELAILYRQQIIEKAFGALQIFLAHAKQRGIVHIDQETGARMLIGSMLTYLFMRGICSPSEEFSISDEELRAIVSGFVTTST